jgi:NACalpha-BTF3-like transcription factor
MTYPVRNQSIPKNNEADALYEDYGYDPNYDAELNGEEEVGFEDEYVDEDGDMGGGAPAMSAGELRTMLYNLKTSGTLNEADYQTFLGRVNAAVAMSPERCAAELAAISNEVYLIANPQAQDTGLDGELPEEDGGSGDLKTRINEMVEKINASELPQDMKDELKAPLERALSSLDLEPTEGQIENAEEALTNAEEEFDRLSSIPPEAIELSHQFNVSAEEIIDAAESAGLDLDNLPQPPDDKVMNFLQALGVPKESDIADFKRIKDERAADMANLKTNLANQDAGWKSNSENPPSHDDFNKSFGYFQCTDEQYTQLVSIQSTMQGDIVTALTALGYRASSGGSADQVVVNGATLDFFDEGAGTVEFSTTLTDLHNIQDNDDFYPAPKNTEASGEYKWFHENDPSGYPEVTYTTD